MARDPDNNFPFGDDDSMDGEGMKEAREMQKKIQEIHSKMVGDNPVPADLDDVLQFLRIINFNFMSLTRLIQTILMKTSDIDASVINLETSIVEMGTRLAKFSDMYSMLDEIEDDSKEDTDDNSRS